MEFAPQTPTGIQSGLHSRPQQGDLTGALCSLLSALCSLLQALCSLLFALCSLLQALCSLLSALCPRLFHPVSSIKYHASSNLWHPASSIEYPVSGGYARCARTSRTPRTHIRFAAAENKLTYFDCNHIIMS